MKTTRRSRHFRRPPKQRTVAAAQQDQAQKNYKAFKQWIASGQASQPITADELQRMLLLASKVK